MCEQGFNWRDNVIIPLLMTVLVGGTIGYFVSLYCGKLALFQQSKTTAVGATLKLGVLAITGEFNDAVVGCRATHIEIRACSLAMLLQGHLKAGAALTEINGRSENEIEAIIYENRAYFLGRNSNGVEIRRIENALNKAAGKYATEIGRITTSRWRYFDWREPKPSA